MPEGVRVQIPLRAPMISKERTLEAIERLRNELKLGVNKHDQISTYHRALSKPNSLMVLVKRGDDGKQVGTYQIYGRDLLDEANEFVNMMAEKKSKDCYDIHGWDDGLQKHARKHKGKS